MEMVQKIGSYTPNLCLFSFIPAFVAAFSLPFLYLNHTESNMKSQRYLLHTSDTDDDDDDDDDDPDLFWILSYEFILVYLFFSKEIRFKLGGFRGYSLFRSIEF